MDTKLIIGVIMFVILFSMQYTLNLILKELREIKVNHQRILIELERRDKIGTN
ncbi:MAG: hypothetical protein H5T96_04155 [Tissierellales bacterium]|nr:hypothetical protein [Tissierellales bacterium]